MHPPSLLLCLLCLLVVVKEEEDVEGADKRLNFPLINSTLLSIFFFEEKQQSKQTEINNFSSVFGVLDVSINLSFSLSH